MWLTLFKIIVSITVIQAEALPNIDINTDHLELEHVQDEGGKVGAFIVRTSEPEYAKSIEEFYANAPQCLGEQNSLPKLEMSDGSFRTTFATETIASEPLESLDCLASELKVMNRVFDQVDHLVSDFIQSLTGKLTYQDHHSDYGLNDSPAKIHVHVYESNSSSKFCVKKMSNLKFFRKTREIASRGFDLKHVF